MPVVESGERDTSTPNRNTVTANPQKNANTMAAHCAPRGLALFSLSPAFWSTHTACSSATCGPRGPTRRMDQPESAYTSAAHASSGRIPPAAGEEHPPCPVLPQTKSKCPQKMDSKKIKRADSVLWRVSGREGPSSGGHYLCVCYIFYTLPRWTRWAKWGCIRARWAWHSSKHRLHSRWAATRVLPAAISSSTIALHRCVPCMGVHVCV